MSYGDLNLAGLNLFGNTVKDGFGATSGAELEELNKALSAGTDNPPTTGGGTMRVQSLDATLKTTTLTMKHIKLWKEIAKLPAYSTVEEYNKITDYGVTGDAFFAEGGLPISDDAQYARASALIKFLGTTREITHALSLVRPAHGDVIARETINGTMFILKKNEKSMFEGNSALNTLAYDGILKQVVDGGGNVLDMRGESVIEETIEEASQLIADNFGFGTDFYAPTRVISDLGKNMYPKTRAGMTAGGNVDVLMGGRPKGIATTNGDINFKPSTLLTFTPAEPTAAGTIAPILPDATTSGAAADDATSLIEAGTYVYKVTACNAYGESLGRVLTGGTITASDNTTKVTLTIVDGGGTGTAATAWYNIYRTAVNSDTGTKYLVGQVAKSGGGATFVDRNATLPNTGTGYVIENSLDALYWRQLAPLMRMPLATIAASYRFMVLLYGTLIIPAPKKHVIIKNIGRLTTTT